jgi:hypothetical protein
MNFEQAKFYLGYDIAFRYNFCATAWLESQQGQQIFLSSNMSRLVLGPTHPASYQMDTRGSFSKQ